MFSRKLRKTREFAARGSAERFFLWPNSPLPHHCHQAFWLLHARARARKHRAQEYFRHARSTTSQALALWTCFLGETTLRTTACSTRATCAFQRRFFVHMGGCQIYGPFWGTLSIRCRITIGTQGTLILTATHIASSKAPSCDSTVCSGFFRDGRCVVVKV